MATKQDQGSGSDKATGEKGVTPEQVGGGKDKDPNNFANNPERAAAAGQKGGKQSHKND
jgi:general stress protein YciG